MKYRPWNMGEIRLLRELRATGLKIEACAKRLNRSARATAVRCSMIGCTKPRPKKRKPGKLRRMVRILVRKGLNDSEIADKLNLSRSTIRNVRLRAGIPSAWNRSECAKQAVACRLAGNKR